MGLGGLEALAAGVLAVFFAVIGAWFGGKRAEKRETQRELNKQRIDSMRSAKKVQQDVAQLPDTVRRKRLKPWVRPAADTTED